MKENRYYVYLHKIASTGEVFYVGKGQRSRLTSMHGRNVSWHNITKDNEWLAEKYKDYIENSLDFSYLSSGLKEEITNYNNANNSSGIRGIIFTGVNKDIVTAQCSKQYKGLSVRFDTKIYGLLPAIKMALEWRERVKKE